MKKDKKKKAMKIFTHETTPNALIILRGNFTKSFPLKISLFRIN